MVVTLPYHRRSTDNRRTLVRWILVLAVALTASSAFAEAPGADSLTRGIQAFEGHHYKEAEGLFDNAISRGGLSRAQTLTAYVDLGVTLVALGKTKPAQHAFEEAALIDPKFVVPPRSGRQATQLANQARHKQEGIGQYHFEVSAPGDVAADAPFKVSVEMSDEQAGLVSLVRVAAMEPGGKSFDTVEPTAPHVPIEIPAEVAVGDQTIAIRFELLDQHDNRLAVIEKLVKVGASTGKVPTKEPVKEPVKEPTKEPAKGSDDDGGGGGSDAESEAAEEGPWSIPHGSKKYTAVRADRAPVIDGVLDDAVWQKAPKDDRFLSTKSKPFGKVTREPTSVQVAYDDTNLYVAFHCTYSKPHDRNDDYAGDEETLLTESENVAVIVDARHGHTGAYEFAVSPAGVRADAELSDQGSVQNLDWHGIWDVDTSFTKDGWTAEFSIPWGSMYMPSSDEAFDVGINFSRHEPSTGETELWALHPPATELFDINFFGHLDGLSRVHPGQRLLLLPYAVLAFDANPTNQSQLNDLTGTNGRGRIYAGAYLRLRPPGPFRLDATFNPDFSAVNPDQALANFDRFELEYPEARPFFAEDAARFEFGATRYTLGDLGGQLFYSRRLGIVTDTAGLTTIVPILWGVKSVFREGGTEAALMNVETVAPSGSIVLNDNATVGRITQTVEGQRVGAILLTSQGASGGYTSGGVDTQLSLYDRHLLLSGFYAGSEANGSFIAPTTGTTTGAAGEGTASWKSQDVYAKATLLDIGKGFQAPLGFFPITGVRAEEAAAGYTPVVRSDLVQQVFVDSQLAIVRDHDTDALVYRRAVVALGIQTIEQAIISFSVQPAIENVTEQFQIGNRITVPMGQFNVLGTQFDVTGPPGRTFVYGIHYNGGDLYNGTRRAPGGMIGLNLGRFTTRLNYTLYILDFPASPGIDAQNFYGHDISLSSTVSYSSLARSTLVLEADTVAGRGTALLTTTLQFGALSALTLSIRGSSGATIAQPMLDTFDSGNLTTILSLTLGASPL